MQPFPTELDPPESDHAPATLAAATDNGRPGDRYRRRGCSDRVRRVGGRRCGRGVRVNPAAGRSVAGGTTGRSSPTGEVAGRERPMPKFLIQATYTPQGT